MGPRSKSACHTFSGLRKEYSFCGEGFVQAIGITRGYDSYVLVESWNTIHLGL